MEENKYKRGSEWRKWDLHVHSLKTHLSNNYSDINEDALIKKLQESEICVVGLTNYFNFTKEDYELKKKLEQQGIIVFLNLELRLTYQNKEDQCCDIHIIFNNKLENIDCFLSNLTIKINGQSKKANTLSSQDDFVNGTVEFDHLVETLEDESLNLKNNYLIGFLSRGHGNGRTSTQYEQLAKKCGFLIHSSDSEQNISEDRIFWLSQGKPLLHSSDAHSIEQIGRKYTWIKADPTFEGLKQILYEPEARVRIQESKPEEKSVYYVIDSVNFDIDKKWKGTIQLNPNLNTIIGGRATGKSTLLKAIAKKISDDSFKCKDDTEKDFLKEYIENISISWLDGQDSENRDIEMLPQGNMYDIARDTKKLDELIQRIIKDTEYNNHIESYESKNDQCKKSITADIQNLFSLQKQIKDMELSLREKGDKKGIKAEIDNLTKRIEELNKGIGVSDEELKQFQENKNKITNIEQCVKQFENDLFILKELKKQSILVPNYSEKFIDLSTDVKNSLSGIFQELKTKIDEEWKNKISNEEATLSRKIEEQRNSLNSIQNSELFKKCKQNEGNNKELNDAEEKLKEENGKLKDFEKIEKQLEERNKLKKEKIESIVSSHISYKTNIQELVELLKIEHDDVVIKTTFRFTDAKFRSFLEDRLNQRGLERQNYIKSLVDNYPNETETACREFLCKALNEEIEYKNYNSNQSVVTEFFATNWFDYSFDLTYQNDTFSQMSDGKKAFVVLKLLLEFSNKKCPILIDQPEDSLDNRAIYNELVTYIRKKKTERQIILVTHNPNIVVGADAENVIVANQHGTDSLNENGMKFQYVNGSLEYTKKRPKDYDSKKDLVLTSQGIREHVCEILEGGEKAFQERENKYGFKQ